MIDTIHKKAGSIPSPKNFFQGKKLPKGFAIPDNILLFYHSWPTKKSMSHSRHVIVIPFVSVSYCVDERIFALTPGEALLIGPHQSRQLKMLGSNCDRLFITFDLPVNQVYAPPTARIKMSRLALRLASLIIDDFKAEKTVRMALTLARLLLELSQTPISYQPHKISPAIPEAVCYINNNLGRFFGNQSVADHLNISESNLRLMFRREMGISMGRYIGEQRLAAAKHRLKTTSMSVEAVANSCGYDSLYSFSHFFKKRTGVSPLQFRHASHSRRQRA